MSNKVRIGVFDSGIGGKSVALAIERHFPDAQVTFVNDSKNVPYGSKQPHQLLTLVEPILHKLSQETDVIVVACNTVSTTLIELLRKKISIPLVAMEPMVKPAAEQSKTKVIAVCATPGTLKSSRYAWLKQTYAKNITILEPDCSDWSYMIESEQVDQEKISRLIGDVCQQGADTIVLGCTHYHWIEEEIKKTADEYGAAVLQPEQPVIKQLKRVLERLP